MKFQRERQLLKSVLVRTEKSSTAHDARVELENSKNNYEVLFYEKTLSKQHCSSRTKAVNVKIVRIELDKYFIMARTDDFDVNGLCSHARENLPTTPILKIKFLPTYNVQRPPGRVSGSKKWMIV